MATMRYLVHNVEESIDFYVANLGFEERQRFGPAMAILARGDLELWLAGPRSSAAQPLESGARPEPGGWNRIVLRTDDLRAMRDALAAICTRRPSEVIEGPGGLQTLIFDPSGNVIELFQERQV